MAQTVGSKADYGFGAGIGWKTKVLYCFQCDFTFCGNCEDCDPNHKPGVVILLYEQYSPASQLYKPANGCTFCKASFSARWECTSCKVSACSCCMYDRARALRFITSHLNGNRAHRIFLAIMPPGWTHSIRATNQLPHLECIDMNPKVFTHCGRCLLGGSSFVSKKRPC